MNEQHTIVLPTVAPSSGVGQKPRLLVTAGPLEGREYVIGKFPRFFFPQNKQHFFLAHHGADFSGLRRNRMMYQQNHFYTFSTYAMSY